MRTLQECKQNLGAAESHLPMYICTVGEGFEKVVVDLGLLGFIKVFVGMVRDADEGVVAFYCEYRRSQ